MNVLDALSNAKYSVSVEERANNFSFFEIEIQETQESLTWIDIPNFLSECKA